MLHAASVWNDAGNSHGISCCSAFNIASLMVSNVNNNNNNNNINDNDSNANDDNINESNTNANVMSMVMVGLGGRAVNVTKRSIKVFGNFLIFCMQCDSDKQFSIMETRECYKFFIIL